MDQANLHPSKIPVSLEPYDSSWAERFEHEKVAIGSLVSDLAQDVQHFGSTSVPNLTAKATVDIMLGVAQFPWPESADSLFETLGYSFYKEPSANWRVYLKAYGENRRGYHLHIVEHNSKHWRTHILFRDYLRQHPKIAAEYGELKVNLARQLDGRRGAYQHGKKVFIDSVMEKAEQWLARRNQLL